MDLSKKGAAMRAINASMMKRLVTWAFRRLPTRRQSQVRWLHFKYYSRYLELKSAVESGFAESGIAKLGAKRTVRIKENEKSCIKYFFMPAGQYKLRVVHSDAAVKAHRKAIFVSFSFSAGNLSIRDLGLSSSGKPFSYLGLGADHGTHIEQFINFTLPTKCHWLMLEFSNRLSRDTKIDVELIYNGTFSAVDLKHSDISRSTAAWLSRVPDAQRARFILYADIDLNVADGSSIWLSSMTNVLSKDHHVILVAKRTLLSNIISSNFEYPHRVSVFEPIDLQPPKSVFSVLEAVEVVRQLDALAPWIDYVVVRGLNAAAELHATRQFKDRSLVYLTDFYETVNGSIATTPDQARAASVVALQAGSLLIQTPLIEDKLRQITNLDFKAIAFPPPIPDSLPTAKTNDQTAGASISIGYAGKVAPNWGVDQLLQWAAELKSTGRKIDLHIVANKISAGKTSEAVGYPTQIRQLIAHSGAAHHANFNRAQSISLMSTMNFVWCWRPPALENNTLELSTKLVEMVAAGARCICYPSRTNRELLGDDYPYFIRDRDGLAALLDMQGEQVSPSVAHRVKARHEISNVRTNLFASIRNCSPKPGPSVVFSSHDFKFVDPFVAHLKAAGYPVERDEWEWGAPKDLQRTIRQASRSNIIFCEWGLANAVWHSNNKREGSRLFIRVHLQEINARARKFGIGIDASKVEKFIFVQDEVREEAIRIFGWPREKTVLVPNFVLTTEYRPRLRRRGSQIRLGMVGIIPQRKRFDRAIDVLETLLTEGHDATLSIKGPRPETISFMNAPSRSHELEFYKRQYERVERDPDLRSRVFYTGWANDVAIWYQDIDFILSPSEFESFHYALADGVLSGCAPIVWQWDGAAKAYSRDWIVDDHRSAAQMIVERFGLSHEDRVTSMMADRKLVADRYGQDRVFEQLKSVMGV